MLAVQALLKPDESVLIFPTVGWQKTNGWEIEVHGLVFEPHAHKLLTRVLRRSLGIDEEELEAGERTNYLRNERRYFLVDNERHKQVTIRFGAGPNSLLLRLQRAFPCPIFSPLRFPWSLRHRGSHQQRIAGSRDSVAEPKVHPFHGEILLVPSNGISVISDIDDTIKISKVTDRHELVRNTFLRPFQACPGWQMFIETGPLIPEPHSTMCPPAHGSSTLRLSDFLRPTVSRQGHST